MEFTQTNLTAINKAIASGALIVEYDGQKITYRSMSELMRARDLIKSELSAAPRVSHSIATFNRG
jgi:hypothetical protein